MSSDYHTNTKIMKYNLRFLHPGLALVFFVYSFCLFCTVYDLDFLGFSQNKILLICFVYPSLIITSANYLNLITFSEVKECLIPIKNSGVAIESFYLRNEFWWVVIKILNESSAPRKSFLHVVSCISTHVPFCCILTCF